MISLDPIERESLGPFNHLKSLGSLQHYRMEGFKGGGGGELMGSPLCRETLVTRAANTSYSSFGSDAENIHMCTEKVHKYTENIQNYTVNLQ